MSELYSTLKATKIDLLRKRKMTQAALTKYALPGYISLKNIRGKETYYLQYRDEYSKLISVHLSKDKLALCQSAFSQKASLEKELQEIDEDLRLLSLVEIDSNQDITSDDSQSSQRILDNAVGISPRHKYLFYLTAGEETGDYQIHFFTKKEIHNVPMIFVNEHLESRIGDYIISASCIVDEAADNLAKESTTSSALTLPSTSQYRTKSGIAFKYQPSKSGYTLSFFYKKKKYSIDYTPYAQYSGDINKIELARMGFKIEQFIRMNAFANEVQKYHERRQNVHTETQKS